MIHPLPVKTMDDPPTLDPRRPQPVLEQPVPEVLTPVVPSDSALAADSSTPIVAGPDSSEIEIETETEGAANNEEAAALVAQEEKEIEVAEEKKKVSDAMDAAILATLALLPPEEEEGAAGAGAGNGDGGVTLGAEEPSATHDSSVDVRMKEDVVLTTTASSSSLPGNASSVPSSLDANQNPNPGTIQSSSSASALPVPESSSSFDRATSNVPGRAPISRVAQLTARLEKDPLDGEARLALLNDALSKGDLERTREVYEDFLKVFPDAVSFFSFSPLPPFTSVGLAIGLKETGTEFKTLFHCRP